jgi:hypothetical protein
LISKPKLANTRRLTVDSEETNNAALASASPVFLASSEAKSIRLPPQESNSESQSSYAMEIPSQKPCRVSQSAPISRHLDDGEDISNDVSVNSPIRSTLSAVSSTLPPPELYETPQRKLLRRGSSSSLSLQRLSISSSQLMLQEKYARTARACMSDLLDSFFTLSCYTREESGCENAPVFYTSDEYPCSLVCLK